jgi:hypothetical protein
MIMKNMMRINDPNSDLESHQRYEEEMERQVKKVWKYKELWDAFDDMEEGGKKERVGESFAKKGCEHDKG